VSRAVTRLDAIVGDVLAFARDTRVRPAATRVATPVLAALAGAEDLVEAHGIDVDLDIDETFEAEIDAPLMEQAFLNLLRNACEAMAGVDRGRRLVVEVQGRELRDPDAGLLPHAVVRVTDTGPGISDDIRERMFNPFFTTRAEGTGLGLAIVHRIVDAHGGRLDVESSSAGTTVTVALPVAFRGERVAGGEDESGRSLGGAVRRRVRDNAADRGAA
jgi:signal transduction histidine kinase